MGNRATEAMDFFLDITDDVFPMTFLKTKLLIVSLSSGQTEEFRLIDCEPLDNVPRAVIEHGHMVLDLAPETDGASVYLLRLRKG